MKVLAYLMFTLLSIIIQLSLMEFINASVSTESAPPKKILNSPNKKFGDVINEMKSQPHALFYQKRLVEKDSSVTQAAYTNTTLAETDGFTDIPLTSTVYDVYEDNSTITENDVSTEMTTESENFTDLSIFQQNNVTTTPKPTLAPKTNFGEDDCYCNLLFNVCDTNCCCDPDCAESERRLFVCSSERRAAGEVCLLGAGRSLHPAVDNLFCAVRTNVPDRRITNRKEYDIDISKITAETLKWHDYKKEPKLPVFRNQSYGRGDALWVLRNGSTYFIDLPVSTVNNYCSDRNPIRFLKDEHIKCNVAFNDLEMFTVLKIVQETKLISALDNSTSNILNCTDRQCASWSVEACAAAACAPYDAEAHEPRCTDALCRNIALAVHYAFHYDDGGLARAAARLRLQSVSPRQRLYAQEVLVTFHSAKTNVTRAVSLSGRPGYLPGRPLLASAEPANHTDKFFSNALRWETVLRYPDNKDGICTLTNVTYKTIDFDSHKRAECRFVSKQTMMSNATKYCMNIQDEVVDFLRLNRKWMLSPFGNPLHLADDDWIEMKVEPPPVPQGRTSANKEIICSDIITKVSFLFAYGDVSESDTPKIKLLSGAAAWSTASLAAGGGGAEGGSWALVVATAFVDVTRPPVYEYAGRPQLNIHLPSDFFFPFPSRAAQYTQSSLVVIACLVLSVVEI